MWIKKKSPIADGDRNYGDSALNIFVFLHRRLWPALGWFQDAPRLELDAGEEAVISKRSADALAERRAPNRSASGSVASKSANSGKRSRIGASAVTPSSLPRKADGVNLVHCHRNCLIARAISRTMAATTVLHEPLHAPPLSPP